MKTFLFLPNQYDEGYSQKDNKGSGNKSSGIESHEGKESQRGQRPNQ